MTERGNPGNIRVLKLFREKEQVGLKILWEENGWDPDTAWIKAYDDALVNLNHYE